VKEAHKKIRPHLEAVAKDVIGRSATGEIRPADSVMTLEATRYTDQGLHDRDRRQIFRRLPLMLAASCELAEPGQFKTMDVAGVSILILREKDGSVRAYHNSCTHRGAKLVEGDGAANRFTCPYHGWTFAPNGELIGMPLREEFGAIDPCDQSLASFPVYESAGLIWVTLDPASQLPAKAFLQGFDQLLDIFDLESFTPLQRRTLVGTNWKLAFEAHLEFYHLPVLHKNTFGPGITNKALYYFWGPHQRLIQPIEGQGDAPQQANLFLQKDRPAETWPSDAMMLGEWILFPNVSLNFFYNGGLGLLISQVIPGADVGQSQTIQTYLMAQEPDDDARAKATAHCDFLVNVVRDEDLATSEKQERNLKSGVMQNVRIGANEAGIQHFHHWFDQIAETDDRALTGLFSYEGQFAGL
jgi:phenylpropionate dioxygenase-like ring-hydroxylating dioxygenase large terminal subunit